MTCASELNLKARAQDDIPTPIYWSWCVDPPDRIHYDVVWVYQMPRSVSFSSVIVTRVNLTQVISDLFPLVSLYRSQSDGRILG